MLWQRQEQQQDVQKGKLHKSYKRMQNYCFSLLDKPISDIYVTIMQWFKETLKKKYFHVTLCSSEEDVLRQV